MGFSELFVFASFGKVRLLKFGNFSEKNGIFELAKFLNSRNFCKKVWKSLETRFSECLEISEIVLFRTFQKLRKNDGKLEHWKSRKTRSDSKTNSKIRLKVWNAGPYFSVTSNFSLLFPTFPNTMLIKTFFKGQTRKANFVSLWTRDVCGEIIMSICPKRAAKIFLH
jgi:hypothetical protein